MKRGMRSTPYSESKLCQLCGKDFIRPLYASSIKRWEAKKFCSKNCLNHSPKNYSKGAKHYLWKGDAITNYGTIHNWTRTNWGIASRCEHCKTKTAKKYSWANISGEYRRGDRSDWMELCYSCHKKYDLRRLTP